MNKEKINIDLKGVPQTLLLPLLGRALFSKGKNPVIHDERAMLLVKSLDYDFDNLLKRVGGESGTIWWIARAYQFDEAIKKYLKDHPTATIVNLGAGLETVFHRVDNGKLTWIDLDLPEVIQLRGKLLSPIDRVHYIAKSILDYSWMDDIKKFGNELFFVAGGFFMYFTEQQVKSILLEMANRFPNAELVFDSIEKRGLKYANAMLTDVNMNSAVLKWGFDYGIELQQWSLKIKFISQIPYFKNIKMKYDFSFLTRIKMFFYDLSKKGGVIHIKFL